MKERRLARKTAPHPLASLVLTVDVQPNGGRLVFVDAPRAKKRQGISSGPFRHASADLEALLHLLQPRREWHLSVGSKAASRSKLSDLLRGLREVKRGETAVIVTD